ncbi:MAG: adenosine-specific kinase [candidate division Zixibacteria bacterium]|nr:adenosine-specific kinase [candidate division Zixibacteria bacterium]
MMNDEIRKMKVIPVDIPEGVNIIFGQSHFIKTVEDLYETLVTSSMSLKFGIAFCEASQHKLVRSDGNDEAMIKMAEQAAFDIACGHTFFICMKDGFPISVLNQVKQVSEVCRIFCATANPLEVLVAETKLGRGVMGVIDGEMPVGIETADDKANRKAFLRTIGYKR